MNSPRFADLGSLSRSPGAAPRILAKASDKTEPTTPDPEEDEPDDEKDDPQMTDTVDTNSASYKAGEAAAMKAAQDRFTAVMASEHFKGREDLASELLSSSMSAEQIIGALAKAPKPAADDKAGDDNASDRQLMRDKLQAKNPDLGAEDDDPDAATAAAKADNFGWGKAHAKVAQRYGAKAAAK